MAPLGSGSIDVENVKPCRFQSVGIRFQISFRSRRGLDGSRDEGAIGERAADLQVRRDNPVAALLKLDDVRIVEGLGERAAIVATDFGEPVRRSPVVLIIDRVAGVQDGIHSDDQLLVRHAGRFEGFTGLAALDDRAAHAVNTVGVGAIGDRTLGRERAEDRVVLERGRISPS